ncbi:MAG: histidinol dehydrogenase [Chloroflexota bacterium]|nr:histidinol dehydrogenase [Chloroflexota bacterium]
MKIIYDFEQAKDALKRVGIDSIEVPVAIKRRIKETFGEELTPEQVVRRIVADVRDKGDEALFDYTRRIDGVSLDSVEVLESEIQRAYDEVEPELVDALNVAAERVRAFHRLQLRHSFKDFMEDGVGQIVNPIESAGVYAPGGTASYPSTVLMTAIPARVAGVDQVIVTTPPRKDGTIHPLTLVAADIAGVDRVFRVGGAQAVAALAFGTESIPCVDKICGPGNLFVTLAKKMVYGDVDIDGIFGPTETVVVADDSASAELCAIDLLAQAEHDVLSAAILITTSVELAKAVDKEVERQLAGLDRADIARCSLDDRGCIVIVDDVEQAIGLANLYAPEHMSLIMRDASSHIESIRNAGGIFIGESSPEVLGDYNAGPSHVMPTGGSARFSSPLNVNDFLKISSVVALSDVDMEALGPAAAAIARVEGLTAHALAAELRLEKGRE